MTNIVYSRNLEVLQTLQRRFKPLRKIRPQSLATPLLKLFSPFERRRIVEINGHRLFLDPLSHLGSEILTKSSYEPEICAVITEHLPVNGAFLDIGANEGFYSSLARLKVGSGGFIAAVEPQSALAGIIEINMLLNGDAPYRIFNAALSDSGGETITLNLHPPSNTGASSLVYRYKWGGGTEDVSTITAEEIFKVCSVDHFDLVKIDVEGFEHIVINALQPLLASHKIRFLMVDYHSSILASQGIDSEEIESAILSHGAMREWAEGKEGGYVLYHFDVV